MNSPALLSSSLSGAVTPRPVCASRGAEAFLSTWIARPAPSLYVNPPRPEYGPQYNGIGECPF